MSEPTSETPMRPHVPSTRLPNEPELEHTQHERVASWTKHLKAVKQDLLDEGTALDDEAIKAEKMIVGLIQAIDNKRKRFMWTVNNVWSPEEIATAKAAAKSEQERMGP